MSAAFGLDDRILATGSIDGTVKLWDVETGKLLATLEGRTDILCCAFSPDGRILAAGCGDSTLRLWEMGSRKLISLLKGHSKPIWAVSFSPDGRTIATGSLDGTAKLWDSKTRILKGTLEGHTDSIRAVSFSPDGGSLATGGNDGTLRIWDPTAEEQRAVIPAGKAIWSLAYSPDGKTLASGGEDTPVKIWDIGTGKSTVELKYSPGTIYSLTFSPDGRTLATGADDHSARLWEAATGRELANLRGHSHAIFAVACSRSGRLLATASDDTTAAVWEVPAGRLKETLKGHSAWILSLSFSPDGRRLAAGSMDGTAKIWDCRGGELRPQTMDQSSWVRAIAFSPEGRLLATGGDSGKVKIWNASTGALSSTIGISPQGLWTLSFSPDGRVLATGGSDNSIDLWDTVTGKGISRLEGHIGAVRSTAFGRDGRMLASGSEDCTARLWDTSTGKLLGIFQASSRVLSVALSPDGQFLAAGSDDGSVTLWELSGGKQAARFTGPSGWVFSLAFSPDGDTLAAGSLDTTVRLWDMRSKSLTATLRGHTDGVFSVVFSPDGRIVASGSSDTSVRFWNATTGALLATALEFAGATDWLVVSPEGFFDGSPGGMQKVFWRFGDGLLDVAEPEQYFDEFYQPGLLKDIISTAMPVSEILRERGDGRAWLVLAEKDRRIPEVTILARSHTSNRRMRVALKLEEAPRDARHAEPSGIRDVRLFLNGTLAKIWHGPQEAGTLETEVTVTAGENLFTAYAFNRDNVKSRDAVLRVKADETIHRDPRAYIISIGINRYLNPGYSLRYAVPDARELAGKLKESLPIPAAHIHKSLLCDEEATARSILHKLEKVARSAHPEDIVILTYAGHGVNVGNRFFLVPHDLKDMRDERMRERLGIDYLKLGRLLETLKAQRLVIIIDACYSGSILASEEWRVGPMNSRGLAQLAWDKGMSVLTASQSDQGALEFRELGHGLLTYFLLKAFREAPRSKEGLPVGEWLDYAALRVPQFIDQVQSEGRVPLLEFTGGRTIQVPRVFHGRRILSWPVAR
jgi:WD40 repeat protein